METSALSASPLSGRQVAIGRFGFASPNRRNAAKTALFPKNTRSRVSLYPFLGISVHSRSHKHTLHVEQIT